jgi:hypothetical protein
MGLAKKGRMWILILLFSLLMAGCASLDRFLDTGNFGDPQEDAPKSSGKRIPLPPTIQDLESERGLK